MSSQEVGRRIRNYLDSRNIPQKALALKINVSVSSLSQKLNGKRKICVELLQQICWALKVEPNTFLKATPPKKEVSACKKNS